MDIVESLKKDSFVEALSCALIVYDEYNKEIARLVPIGKWALFDEDLLCRFSEWRQKFMSFFLTRFHASKESTKGYLKNLSIEQNDRILFAIYADDLLVGHIGLSNINENNAELDNAIRGVSGNHKDLIYFSEKVLLTWAFDRLAVNSVHAQVLSKNFLALSLHKRFGFKLRERQSLKKVVNEKLISYEVCDEELATEKFFLDIIEVFKENFLITINPSHS